MKLQKVKLGDYIEFTDNRNKDNMYVESDVKGISTSKIFIETKANLNSVSLSNYKIVNIDEFAYVADTSRRGDKIGLAYADKNPCIISSIYTTFRVKDNNKLLPRYLMMFFNRPEFDRYARFNSWGSARETFLWEDFCDIELVIPPIEIQKKYVAIYESMLKNLHSYEKGLDDLKLVCDGYIDSFGKDLYKKIGYYIGRNTERNQENKYTMNDIKGFNNNGEFIEPMRLFSGEIATFKIIRNNYFVYNSRINSTINKLSVALNEDKSLLVSPAYETFFVNKTSELEPYYLYMILQRNSFARKVLFNSFGSSTIVFDFDNLCEIEIPVPDINIQRTISKLYKVYKKRLSINNKLKEKIKNICPILIRGSIKESEKGA